MTQQTHGSSLGSELKTDEKVYQHAMNGAIGGLSHPQGENTKQTADQQTVDAGLKSLDHCACIPEPNMCPSSTSTRVFRKRSCG